MIECSVSAWRRGAIFRAGSKTNPLPNPSAASRFVNRAGPIIALFVLIAAPVAGAPRIAAAEPAAVDLIQSRGCIACHYIPGVPGATGTLGPSLKNLSSRDRIARGAVENTRENLRAWLKNPKKIKPDTLMPNIGLDDGEIDILIEFLSSL